MKKLMIYLKDYRKESVLAPLFKLLEALFDLLVPIVVARIIDRGIAEGNRPLIIQLTGVMILLAGVGLACSITPRGCGTCLQHHRAVFCRQGIGGLRDQDPAGAV